jgi:hypothetical protein
MSPEHLDLVAGQGYEEHLDEKDFVANLNRIVLILSIGVLRKETDEVQEHGHF